MNSRNLKTAAIVAVTLAASGYLVSEFTLGAKFQKVLPDSLDKHADTFASCVVGAVLVTTALVLTKGK